MTTHSLPAGMVRAVANAGPHEGYMPGFGNDFETEALPGALPQGMNGSVAKFRPMGWLVAIC